MAAGVTDRLWEVSDLVGGSQGSTHSEAATEAAETEGQGKGESKAEQAAVPYCLCHIELA